MSTGSTKHIVWAALAVVATAVAAVVLLLLVIAKLLGTATPG